MDGNLLHEYLFLIPDDTTLNGMQTTLQSITFQAKRIEAFPVYKIVSFTVG